MKRILLTCTDVMMYQFLLPHVCYLVDNEISVDVACSYAEEYKDEGYHTIIKNTLPTNCNFYSIHLERSPFKLKNRIGYKELKTIIEKNTYDLIWTNEPVMSVITRLASRKTRRKNGTKVLYMTHGFHFASGAPKKNWIAYPIEKVMSTQCDAMCMICWEDYYFAQRHMLCKKLFHIDGIGLDTTKFSEMKIERSEKRKQLGIGEDEIFILSVGELQKRKNHEPIIRAIGGLKAKNVKYMICGKGELEEHLKKVASEVGIEKRLLLPGHVYDIPEILKAADIFVHPSKREGLGIAALEAMASGLPLVTSDVQGIKDYMQDGKTGFVLKPDDIEGFRNSINILINHPEMRREMGENNILAVQKYDIDNSKKNVYSIIKEMVGK